MKRNAITMFIVFVLVGNFSAFAQTDTWKLAGKSLTGTEKLGSKNNFPINFITNNATRLTLTASGNLNFVSSGQSIQFANPLGLITR